MSSFADNLAQLAPVDGLQRLFLLGADGQTLAEIENAPGTQGSFRVYHHVAQKWGGIGVDAAQEALTLFAEHTDDARLHPGKHPNIDRLFDIIERNLRFEVRCE
ncbi:MAG: DUF2322 family protein [Hydrogenophilales bacterium]|nr:DUF2322 family protein [Hydrogenophilales bacterium]